MMVTTLVAGAVVPLWDRELVRALVEAVEGLPPDNVTTWQLGVMNDDGEVYRRIVAESSAECVALVEHFSGLQFKLVKLDGQPAMRKLPFGNP